MFEFFLCFQAEALYFVGLFACLAYVTVHGGIAIANNLCRSRLLAVIYVGLATYATYITWSYILEFVVEDLKDYDSLHAWLTSSNIFGRAYRMVSFPAPQWFFSSQLLHFVATVVVFWKLEAASASPALFVAPFIIVAFLGAVSLALPLFLLHLRGASLYSRQTRIPTWLALSIGVGLISATMVPEADQFNAYKSNLVFLHVILFAPILWQPLKSTSGVSVWKFFTFLAVYSAVVHVSNLYVALSALEQAAAVVEAPSRALSSIDSLTDISAILQYMADLIRDLLLATQANACQISISADLLFVSIGVVLFVLQDAGVGTALAMLIVCTLGSVSFAFPAYLAMRAYSHATVSSD